MKNKRNWNIRPLMTPNVDLFYLITELIQNSYSNSLHFSDIYIKFEFQINYLKFSLILGFDRLLWNFGQDIAKISVSEDLKSSQFIAVFIN